MAIVGGCGHVGLPLGLAFADAGLSVVLFDINPAAVDRVRRGQDAVPRARARTRSSSACSADGRLDASTDPESVGAAEHVVVVVGHPGRRAPQPRPEVRAHRRSSACSTTSATASSSCCAAPSTRASPAMVERLLAASGRRHRRVVLPRAHRRGQGHGRSCASCPRSCRVAHRPGRASGPRSCSGTSPTRSSTLEVEEAELAKLFTNTWRYIKFAAANQLYMIANDFGARLRAHPRGHDPGLPAGGRHARRRASPPGRACSRTRCSWPRSTTTTSRSATPA